MKRLIASTVVLSAGLFLSACSSSINVGDLEQQVQQGLADQLGGDWTVSCPDSMEVQAGLTTNCMATDAGGKTVDVNITQTDNQGNVAWEVPSTNIDVAKLQDTVGSQISEQVGGDWTVTCPQDIPLQKGLTTNCEATSADGQSVMVNITQTDDQGNVSWETA